MIDLGHLQVGIATMVVTSCEVVVTTRFTNTNQRNKTNVCIFFLTFVLAYCDSFNVVQIGIFWSWVPKHLPQSCDFTCFLMFLDIFVISNRRKNSDFVASEVFACLPSLSNYGYQSNAWTLRTLGPIEYGSSVWCLLLAILETRKYHVEIP